MPGISERLHIRWGDEPASEPTNTLVLTSLHNRFVDIRIFNPKEGEEGLPNKGGPLSRLQWAFAGLSESRVVESASETSSGFARCIWRHWVDSKVPVGDKAPVDEGDMYPQLDTPFSYEYGTMVYPDTGDVSDYEEKWRDITVLAGLDGVRHCIVLTLDRTEEQTRGMIVRIGQFCSGLLKIGDDINIEQWEFMGGSVHAANSSDPFRDEGAIYRVKGGEWTRRVKLGSRFMPCVVTFQPEDQNVGETAAFGDYQWTIVEKEEW